MHMGVVQLLTFSFWLIFLLCRACFLDVGALNDEGFALLTFKWSVREDPDGSLSNWNSSDSNPCSWNGVTCRDERVVAITVPRKKLLGSIPSALGSLSSLRHVNLRNNRLYGSLPSGFFGATGLRSIVLYGNAISGPLPSTIGNLSFLQMLDVSQNFLSWSVPISLLNCKRLKTLDLSRNNFTGSLPYGIGNSLGLLEKLDLSCNRFNGSIPADIGNLSNLQVTFNLSHNAFSGSIPATLGNIPEKVYIDLTYNNLTGLIPQYGALMNRGPTAFIGNPGLCGTALKNPCSSSDVPANAPSTFPYLPSSSSPPGKEISSMSGNGGRRGLSKHAVIAIISSDVVCICVIALVFLCCYWRTLASRDKDENENSNQAQKSNKECLCFRRDKSRTPSEAAEQHDLIALDRNVNFDLDELLKASAFVLGKSAIGIVYKVILEDGLTLAVRRLGEGGSQRCKEFQVEVEAIGKIKHPNIVNLRAYYWSIDEKLLIYEYIPNGNLSDAIHGKVGTTFLPMPWLVRLNIVKELAKGLAYLHEFSPKKYVHGDLKPTNILLGHNMEPYISDFGLGRLANIAGGSPVLQSNRVASEKQLTQSLDIVVSPMMGTTFCYQAPEAFKALKPSQKWDVYSYGVILLELITGRSPVVLLGNSDMDLVKWVQLCIDEKKSLAEVLDPCLAGVTDTEDQIVAVLKIALACVQVNPERRPSMRHVLTILD